MEIRAAGDSESYKKFKEKLIESDIQINQNIARCKLEGCSGYILSDKLWNSQNFICTNCGYENCLNCQVRDENYISRM